MTYPKWVSRGHDIGVVLCLDEAEEAKLLADWARRDEPAAAVQIDVKDVESVMAAAAPERKKPGPKPKVK